MALYMSTMLDYRKIFSENIDLDLGYIFLPCCRTDLPCHQRLTIHILPTPTQLYCDPEVACIYVAYYHWKSEFIKVSHPWHWKSDYYVDSSWVILKDRLDKVVEPFIFGGKLNITSGKSCTPCTLVSTVPILPCINWASKSSMLAEDVEILLAAWREKWEEQHPFHDFKKQLALLILLLFI